MPVFNKFYLVDNKLNPAHLASTGPTFPVEIRVPAELAKYLTDNGQPVPQPVAGVALFDTGASVTCVDESIIKSLGVNSVGEALVSTPSGVCKQAKYPAQICFPTFGPSGLVLDFNSVMGSELKNQNIHVLVGRDVLRSMVFTYNGPGGFVTLGY